MRWRIGHVWALAGCVAFAFLLVFASHPGFAASAPTGMSAPAAPAAALESAPVAKLLQSQFDWNGHALRSTTFSLALVAIHAKNVAQQNPQTAPPHYGPLHRRPPPSFS
jgi:hypothetical protein